MLDTQNRKPSIVLLAGSSAGYGFQSQMIVDSIGMPVINLGYSVNLGLKYMLYEVPRRLQSGDILVFAPEEFLFRHDGYYGSDSFVKEFYLHMVPLSEICPDQMRCIIELTPRCVYTSGLIPNMFKDKTTKSWSHNYNKYGDRVAHWSDSLTHNTTRPTPGEHEEFFADAFDAAITCLKDLQKKGVRVVMFNPPGDNSYFKDTNCFTQITKVFKKAGFEYPDTIGIDLFDNKYTYDTPYHLNREGSYFHTQHLIKWLKQCGIENTVCLDNEEAIRIASDQVQIGS
jgi:hypothetical protein